MQDMTMMFAHAQDHACMLACVHTIFKHALAPISAQLGQRREIEVSMERGGGILISTFIPLVMLPFVSLRVSFWDIWSCWSRTSVFLSHCYPSLLDNWQLSTEFPFLTLVGLGINPYDHCLRMLLIIGWLNLTQTLELIWDPTRPDQTRPDSIQPGLTNFSALGCARRLKLWGNIMLIQNPSSIKDQDEKP